MFLSRRRPTPGAGGPAILSVLFPLILISCADAGTDTVLEPAATVQSGTAPLTVKVVAPDGATPVSGATVRAYGIRTDGTVGPVGQPAFTSSGGAVTLQLPVGSYCLSARTAPPEWVQLDIVTPPEPLAYTPIENAWGPVVTGRYGSLPVTQRNFEACYTKLPVQLKPEGSYEKIRMADPFGVKPNVRGLDGELLAGVDVFAVIPITVPWSTPADPEVKTAFFSVVDPTNLPADLIVSPGAPYAIEFQTAYHGFNITGTVKGMGGGAGTTEAFTMDAAPLMCHQTTREFPAGAPGLDFLKVNFGYHASLALAPDPSKLAVQIKHAGEGPVTVTFRTDLPNGRRTTTVSFSCADGECGAARVRNSGGNTQSAQVFHAPQTDGSTKTSVVLAGIPANHRRVLFAAKTQGDAIPLASRDVATDAFFVVPRPARCSVQQSNDDKWAIGDL